MDKDGAGYEQHRTLGSVATYLKRGGIVNEQTKKRFIALATTINKSNQI